MPNPEVVFKVVLGAPCSPIGQSVDSVLLSPFVDYPRPWGVGMAVTRRTAINIFVVARLRTDDITGGVRHNPTSLMALRS